MKTYIAELKSQSAFGFNRPYQVEKLNKESHDDFDKRTWRERCHYDPTTRKVFIPPMAFKKTLEETAKYLGVQIKGKGKATYTKHFMAGILCMKPLELPITVDQVPSEVIFVPTDGKPGGKSPRVHKTFPVLHDWSGKLEITVLDETITKDVLYEHLVQAGIFVGVGRFRPIKGGYYGRFNVVSLKEA